jgi:hypothetical protein
LASLEPCEAACDDVADGGSDVDGRTFFSDGQARGDGDGLHAAASVSRFDACKYLHILIVSSDRGKQQQERKRARTKANDLMLNVLKLKYPLMMNPARIHLISEIPDPAAYGA